MALDLTKLPLLPAMADAARNHGDHLPRTLKLWGAANAFTDNGPLPSPARWVPLIPQEVHC